MHYALSSRLGLSSVYKNAGYTIYTWGSEFYSHHFNKRGGLGQKNKQPHHFFVIEVPVSSQKSELCICVLGVSIWHLFLQLSDKTLELFRCYVAIFHFIYTYLVIFVNKLTTTLNVISGFFSKKMFLLHFLSFFYYLL